MRITGRPMLTTVLFGLACGLNISLPDDAIQIGELRTDQISVGIPDPNATTNVKIEFGTGELVIQRTRIEQRVADLRGIADRAVILERGRDVWTGSMETLGGDEATRFLGV